MVEDVDVKEMREVSAAQPPVEQEEHIALTYATDVRHGDLVCWVRIPNKFQHRKIQKAAIAARARRVAEYKDPDSDAGVTLVSGVDQVFEEGLDTVREFLLGQHMRELALEAMLLLERSEDWSEIDEQRDRYNQMLRMGDIDTDEFKVTESILIDYATKLQEKSEELVLPFKVKYEGMDEAALRDKVGRAIVKADCDDEFTNVYNQWQIFYGTRQERNHNKYYFQNFDAVMEADDHIIEILTEEFAKLGAVKAGELKKALLATTL